MTIMHNLQSKRQNKTPFEQAKLLSSVFLPPKMSTEPQKGKYLGKILVGVSGENSDIRTLLQLR